MIAGRLHWKSAGAKLAGRNALAAFDFATGSLVLTEAGSKRRASLHVFAGEEALQAVDPGGIDVMACGFGGVSGGADGGESDAEAGADRSAAGERDWECVFG